MRTNSRQNEILNQSITLVSE